MSQTAPTLRSKQHYEVLDGLRGVAALIVVAFHLFEPWSGGNHAKQILNHGYLAVDFFFLLSGFVVAYAYDDRWSRMSLWDFTKRRLIRLQPMVVLGSVVGAALFYSQSGSTFPLIHATPVSRMLLVMLVGFTLVPLPPSMDIRGWNEMHPLNGPAWSLFFEYVANILYALVLRRLRLGILAALTLLAAVFLVQLALTSSQGDVIGGWSLNADELHTGFARLLFPFLAGMLLMRSGRRIHVKGAFGLCSLLLAVVLCLPRLPGAPLWANSLYDSLTIIFVFPLIVAIGAGEGLNSSRSTALSKWLGGISYPLYITHYPIIYLYTAWVLERRISPGLGALVGSLAFVTSVGLAYAYLKLYDEPVRRWLSRRFLSRAA